jgi:protein involved in polysaccharide export with SLBB domain
MPSLGIWTLFLGGDSLQGGSVGTSTTRATGLRAMINRFITLGSILAIGLMLAGCYRDFGPVVAEPQPLPGPVTPVSIQVGDRLTVTVYGEPNLTGVYDVTPGGFINLPLIGNVRAVDRTYLQLQREIEDRYSRGKFLQEPKVTIAVVEYRPVYLFGEVARPGSIPYRPGLNILTAVTAAGGLTYRSSREKIYLQRSGEQVWNEYPQLSSVTIMPGDLIRIPERFY